MSMIIRRGIARAVKAAPVVTYAKEEPKKVEVVEPKEVNAEETEKVLDRKEIESMPYFGLKSLATKNGIEVANKKTAELRVELIEKLGL